MYAAELARRYPQILAVSVHPGAVDTDLIGNLSWIRKKFVHVSTWATGTPMLTVEQGCFNQTWAATAKRSEIVNGALYVPVGVLSNETLDKDAKNPAIAKKLWEWTDQVLAEF